jgi:hypothetical protein
MIIPALIFAFWAVACSEVKDSPVYEQADDANTEYETMNEEPHYLRPETEYTPFDDDVSASTNEGNQLDGEERPEMEDTNPEMELEEGDRIDNDGTIGDDRND